MNLEIHHKEVKETVVLPGLKQGASTQAGITPRTASVYRRMLSFLGHAGTGTLAASELVRRRAKRLGLCEVYPTDFFGTADFYFSH